VAVAISDGSNGRPDRLDLHLWLVFVVTTYWDALAEADLPIELDGLQLGGRERAPLAGGDTDAAGTPLPAAGRPAHLTTAARPLVVTGE
jgi:hypothetical protein